MGELMKQCWRCKRVVTELEIFQNDGCCSRCGNEIDERLSAESTQRYERALRGHGEGVGGGRGSCLLWIFAGMTLVVIQLLALSNH